MAITASDVTAICPTSLPDAVVDDIICMVESRIGDCVTSSYTDECTQDIILKYAACYFVESMGGEEVSQEKAANGSSVTYDIQGGGEGLRSNQWGRLLIQVDTAGCYSNLVADTFLCITVGPTNPSCY